MVQSYFNSHFPNKSLEETDKTYLAQDAFHQFKTGLTAARIFLPQKTTKKTR